MRKKIEQLQSSFRRILAMPITRSTYREMQNVILLAAEGNLNETGSIFDALLNAQSKSDLVKKGGEKIFKNFLEDFSIPARVAKDVFDRGEFISLLTSDIISQPNRTLLLNRIRRIDGEELQFITDIDNSLHLVNHMLGRLQEVERSDNTKKISKGYKKELAEIKKKLEELIG